MIRTMKIGFITLMLLVINQICGQIPENLCITEDENQLLTLINSYREKNGVSKIALSRSLTYVAKLHVRDLYHNKPDTSYCSLSSWSDQGSWSPCCHSKMTPQPACILIKPKEIAKFPGDGHELAYWENGYIIPDSVLAFWQNYPEAVNLILNREKWAEKPWKSIGIGIYEGYASVWVSNASDTAAIPPTCQGEDADLTIIKTKASNGVLRMPINRYFLIFGSYATVTEASGEVEKYKKEGFFQAKVLEKDRTYKVSLSDHATITEAKEAKAKLPRELREAWILKY